MSFVGQKLLLDYNRYTFSNWSNFPKTSIWKKNQVIKKPYLL